MIRMINVPLLALVALSCTPRKFNSTETMAARPGPDGHCGNPGQPGAPNPNHCPGEITIDGPWGYDEQTLNNNQFWNRGSQPFVAYLFGATVLIGPDGKGLRRPGADVEYVIRDQHYHVGNGKVGIRPIPYAGPGKVLNTASGERIEGPKVLDETMRATYRLPPDAPLFGLSICNLDGDPVMSLDRIGERVRGRSGHVGMYIGNGYSRHQNGGGGGLHLWDDFIGGQPQTVIGISIDGVDQALLNQNMVAMSRLMTELNGGFDSNFPSDHRGDPVGQVTLRQMLDVFATWVDRYTADGTKDKPEYTQLMTTPAFAMFCAELANVVVNLGANLPLTLDGFVRTWGPQRGQQLWNILSKRIAELDANPMYADEKSSLASVMPRQGFEPLWARDGLQSPLRAIQPGQAMLWPLETTGDAIAGAVETFGNFPVFGPMPSLYLLLGSLQVAQSRAGIPEREYMGYVIPVIAKIVKHAFGIPLFHAMGWEAYLNNTIPNIQDLPPPVIAAIQAQKNAAAALQYRSEADAWSAFERDIASDIAAYRGYKPPFTMFEQQNLKRLGRDFLERRLQEATARHDEPRIQRLQRMLASVDDKFYHDLNANPILFLRVAQGIRKSHPLVKVIPIGTAFQANQLRSKAAGARSSYMPGEQRPQNPIGGGGGEPQG